MCQYDRKTKIGMGTAEACILHALRNCDLSIQALHLRIDTISTIWSPHTYSRGQVMEHG